MTTACVCTVGVNIGGAGAYIYDDPVNEAPASVSTETEAKPEEERRAPARGPVKGKEFKSINHWLHLKLMKEKRCVLSLVIFFGGGGIKIIIHSNFVFLLKPQALHLSLEDPMSVPGATRLYILVSRILDYLSVSAYVSG